MKVLTSFTNLTTAEGERIAYTYSVVDEDGNIISQNNKENFVLMNTTQLKHLSALKEFITNRMNTDE